ncbi:CPBP family intramembrane metalloprotease [Patescibacteria group bacterium]|nr:CPBP family intramembrane metalloprotease [Patescibacteria group bacterium]
MSLNNNKKETTIKHSTILATFLLVVWGFYRFLFKLPEEIEELIIKPLVWLVPVYFLVKKEKKGVSSVGITSKNLFPAIYISLILGILFAVEGMFINFIKHKGVDFSANLGSNSLLISLGISFATAVSEEIAFRGYLFNRIWEAIGNEWKANLITSIVWTLIHLPIAIFWWELNLAGVLGYLVLTLIFGIGSAFVFAKTKNVASSVLLHIFWEWPIVLFR